MTDSDITRDYEGTMEVNIQKKVTVSIDQVILPELEFLCSAVKQYNQILPGELVNRYIQHALESALEKAKR